MLSLDNKVQNNFAKSSEALSCPALLSVIFHAMIFAVIFGTFSFSENNKYEFQEFKLLSIQNFEESKQSKNITNTGQGQLASRKKMRKKSQEQANYEKQYNSYANLIAAELERRKSRFSMNMAPDEVRATVVFKVKIDKNGDLTEFKMTKGSGYEFFDKIAEKILTCEQRFPAPPVKITARDVEFMIPIVFDSMIS